MSFDVVLRNPGGSFNLTLSGGEPPPPTADNFLRFAAATPLKAYVGVAEVVRMYFGSTLVYDSSSPSPPPAEISFRAFSAANNANTASLSVVKPAGTAEGDLMIAFCAVYDLATFTLTPPAGWTQLLIRVDVDTSGVIFYKIATASEPANYSFTVSTSTRLAISISAYSNVNQTTPFGATIVGGAADGVATTSRTIASINTTAANSMLVYWSAAYESQPTVYPPGMTLRFVTELVAVSLDEIIPVAGATGSRTVTQEALGGNRMAWSGFMMSLIPA